MAAKRIVITVDGLAGSGKTAISRALAERLSFVHFNSGAMYRVAGLIVRDAGVSMEDETKVIEVLRRHTISMDIGPNGHGEVRLDHAFFAQNDRLVTPEISEAASMIATHSQVRSFLKEQQQNVFPGQNVVAEGRDMGTVIFPEAPLKFFIDANSEVRAERRLAQLLAPEASPQEREDMKKVLKIEILERDERDQRRAVAPTVPAKDAIIIPNSGPSLTQIIDTMYDLVTQRGLVSNLVK